MSDENDNQTASAREEAASPARKSSAGVFSWLTGSRASTDATATASGAAGDLTIHSATAASSGSRSGSVSPAGTASPASGTRSPALSSSPPRSPARFVVPNLTAAFGGGGGRFGPTIVMGMGTHSSSSSAHAHADAPSAAASSTSTSTSTTSALHHDDQQQEQEQLELPPGVVITTKTFGGDTTTSQAGSRTHATPQLKTDGSVITTTTSTSTSAASDNQLEPLLTVTTTPATTEPTRVVRYITTTTTGSTTHTPVASPMGASGKRYVKTTTTGGLPMALDGQEIRQEGNVRYITRTVGSTTHTPVASPVAIGGGATSVRYVTTMGASPIGASGQPGGAASTTTRFFPPQVQPPQVHTVTRVVNGQQVQVPMPVGEPHHHNVQYITRSVSPALSISSNVSSSSGSVVASPVGAVEQRQQVRYITKTINHVPVATPPQSTTSTTTQAVVGSGLGGGSGSAGTVSGAATSVSGGVPLRTVVASTLLNNSPNHTGLELGEEVEGLPAHFIGIQRTLTDTDSSDGEEHEVKMVFDIMSQSFKPVGKRRSRRSTAAAASAGAAAGDAAGGASVVVGAGAAAVAGTAAVAAASGAQAATASEANASAGANAQADVDAKAGAAAIATANASVGSTADVDLEEKAPVAATAVEDDATGKKSGSGLAAAAAIGLTAAVAVGAAAAVAAGAAGSKTPSSPMMKLDTVAGSGESAALVATPGGPKKRTPSQTKPEQSPRKFFSKAASTKASAAANQGPLLPDESVTMDLEPEAQYAELRSPASHEGSRFAQVGLLLQVRKCRWLLISMVSVAILVILTAVFYKGITLYKFQSTRYSLSKQYDMADAYNGYVALFTALVGKPIEMLACIVLPILTLTISEGSLLAPKLSSRLPVVLFILSFLVCYLLASSFHGINVQLRVQSSTPVIAAGDLSLQLAGAGSLGASTASASLIAAAAANASSNASLIVSETTAKNAITNTVLRNVVEQPVDSSASSLLCNNTVDYTNLLGANAPSSLSSVWTTTVASYGFPMRSWQDEMLPGAMPEANYTLKLSEKAASDGVVLPMRVRTAANLFLHGVHVARDTFRWFDGKTTPLGVQAAVNAKYGSATDGKLTHVSVADLLGLTNASNTDEAASTPAFLNQVRSLFNRSLDGAASISRAESSLEFTGVSLPNGYTFESVTMEIPLVASFLSRRLALSGNTFVEEEVPANETDVYYDVDIATDCGPYTGACEVRVSEKDASGTVFEPATAVRAFSLCNNSLGTDDVEVFFDGSKATKTVSYTCNGQLDSGMLVVSVSSRIVGEALIEAPSTAVPRLVEGLGTLKNARKIYSLTVGKLSWPTDNLATAFHAACAAGVGKCGGLQYALTAALKNTTETTASGNLRGASTSTEEDNGDNHYLVLGNDYLPLKLLSPVDYNTTESTSQTVSTTKSTTGYSLVTITKPVEADSLFENDGDVIVATNFKTVNWGKTRQGSFCSATVESRLNSVLNNHFYIERGVQPAYTAGMFFLFQDAVAKEEIALGLVDSGALRTLRFASTIEYVALVASIPLLSVVLTLTGCGIIVLAVLYVFIVSRRKIYAIQSGSHDADSDSVFSGRVSQETVARIKLNSLLFPSVVLHRRVIDLSNSNHSTTTGTTALSPGGTKTAESSHGHEGIEGESVDAFALKGMQMEHDRRDLSVDMAK